MIAFMDDLSSLERIFIFCAMVGGGLFMVRMVLLFIGGDTDIDIDGDVDTDFDSDQIQADPYGKEKFGEGDLRILCQLRGK